MRIKKGTKKRIALTVAVFAMATVFIAVSSPMLLGNADNETAGVFDFSNLWKLIWLSRQNQDSQTYRAGDYTESISVDERDRTYLLHVPSGYSKRNTYPLVLVYHGGGGSGEKTANHTNFSIKADQEGFIVVYPDGVENSWSDGRGTTRASVLGVDDVKFTNELINSLSQKLSINENRVYAVGVSNGGMMTLTLACELTGPFAAIGSVIANLPEPLADCNPSKPIPLVMINGSEDPFVSYEGGDCCNIGTGGRILSLEDTFSLFADKNSCTNGPVSRFFQPVVDDGTEVELRAYTKCTNNAPVLSYLVHGMGHSWPPKEPQFPQISGQTSKNISATNAVWNFFSNR